MKTPNAITLKDILRTRFDELTARFRRPKAADPMPSQHSEDQHRQNAEPAGVATPSRADRPDPLRAAKALLARLRSGSEDRTSIERLRDRVSLRRKDAVDGPAKASTKVNVEAKVKRAPKEKGPSLVQRLRARFPAAAKIGASKPKTAPAAKPAPQASDALPSLAVALAGWRRAGWVVVVTFVCGGTLWAATAQLDGAVVAPGIVGVESNRKTVQHLEGGIVKEILVREGDRVTAGQVVARFDDTQPRAVLEVLEQKWAAALAQKSRLEAERDDRDDVVFPDNLLELADRPEISALMLAQVDTHKANRATIRNQESILGERADKYRREIGGLRAQVTASEQQLALIEEELATVAQLFREGLTPKSRMLALQRRAAEINGNIGEYRARIARAQEGIGEVNLQVTLPQSRSRAKVTEQLDGIIARLADLDDKILAARDVLSRTAVLAPANGRVLDLRVHTAGAVMQPGERLLDLVPEGDRLVLDVRVSPKDIDTVYQGMPARARMSAFNARSEPPLTGTIVTVSADRVVDPITGQPYFTARLVPDTEDQDFDLKRLMPGMQAEVYLVTGERSALDYILEPVTRTLRRAGRES